MLHRSRRDFDALASRLASEGIGALALDLRGSRRLAGLDRRRTSRRWSRTSRRRAASSSSRSDVQPARVGIARRVARREPGSARGGRRSRRRQPGAVVPVARLPRPADRDGDAEIRQPPGADGRRATTIRTPRVRRATSQKGTRGREISEPQRRGPRHDDARAGPVVDAARWWTGFAGRCYDPWLTFRIPGFQTCAKTPSYSASPEFSSAFSSAGSSAASRRGAPRRSAGRCRGTGAAAAPGADRTAARRERVPQRCGPRRNAIRATPTRASQLGQPLLRLRTVRGCREVVRGGCASRAAERERQHGSRDQLLLHEPARSRARAVRAIARDRSEAFENAAERRHRARLRQAGSRGRGEGVAAGPRRCARIAGSAARPSRRSTALRSAHPDVPGVAAKQPGS